jgi:hypothetical protein
MIVRYHIVVVTTTTTTTTIINIVIGLPSPMPLENFGFYGKNLESYLVSFCSGSVTKFSRDPKRLHCFLGHPFEYVFANVKL